MTGDGKMSGGGVATQREASAAFRTSMTLCERVQARVGPGVHIVGVQRVGFGAVELTWEGPASAGLDVATALYMEAPCGTQTNGGTMTTVDGVDGIPVVVGHTRREPDNHEVPDGRWWIAGAGADRVLPNGSGDA